jgi:fumarate reductase subunit C
MYAISKINKDEVLKEKTDIYLPMNWWNKNYSYKFHMKENNKTSIFPLPIHDQKIIREGNSNNLFNNYNWKFSDGDYQVKTTYYNSKDFQYYYRKRNIILKYSLYPALIFALLFTFSILNIIADFPL